MRLAAATVSLGACAVLAATAGAAPPTISVSAIDFGTVEVGQQSAPHAVSLTNPGPDPIRVARADPLQPFVSDPAVLCDNVILQAGESCGGTVRFAPTYGGPHGTGYGGFLDFRVDGYPSGLGSGLRVDLSGFAPGDGGTVPLGPTPDEAAATDAQAAAASAPPSAPAAAALGPGVTQAVTATLANTTFANRTTGVLVASKIVSGQAGTRLVAPGSSLIKSQASGVQVTCPSKVTKKDPKAKCTEAVLLSGTLFLPQPGQGTLTVTPTPAGKKLLKQASAYAKAQRKKGRKPGSLTLAYATTVTAAGSTGPGTTAARKLTVKP